MNINIPYLPEYMFKFRSVGQRLTSVSLLRAPSEFNVIHTFVLWYFGTDHFPGNSRLQLAYQKDVLLNANEYEFKFLLNHNDI